MTLASGDVIGLSGNVIRAVPATGPPFVGPPLQFSPTGDPDRDRERAGSGEPPPVLLSGADLHRAWRSLRRGARRLRCDMGHRDPEWVAGRTRCGPTLIACPCSWGSPTPASPPRARDRGRGRGTARRALRHTRVPRRRGPDRPRRPTSLAAALTAWGNAEAHAGGARGPHAIEVASFAARRCAWCGLGPREHRARAARAATALRLHHRRRGPSRSASVSGSRASCSIGSTRS